MNLASLIFMGALFVIGIWCIFLVRGSFMRNVEAEEKTNRLARARFQLDTTPQQALIRERAAARREAERQRAERWKNLTPSLVNQAFKNFYGDETESSFDASLVSAAFEKFTKEMSVKQ
jgi:ABC-type lipoprotein release transport system permease subunit